MNSTRVLVVIASYGRSSDVFLRRLIQEYQSMSFMVDIVVCSNVERPLPDGVELVVGMPTNDPWSLPFAHKKILADRVDQYDLFIYSEDDTLATERNVRAFLDASEAMEQNEIVGFIRYEDQPDGTIRYCDVNGHYHWDPSSVVRRGNRTFAFFSNEHAAFYILTKDQLRRAISSGGFSVAPHRGKYDLACTAATDPYTQCGFRKLVCISDIAEFRLHHLPNKYIGTRFGTHESLFQRQMQALMEPHVNGCAKNGLVPVETRLQDAWYSKDYYEPVRQEIVNAIPGSPRTVLSIGCGSGETEKWLAAKGAKVTAVCLDPIIASCAQGDGVEALSGNLATVKDSLKGKSYDCLLFANVLHLAANPAAMLAELGALLAPGGSCVVLVPNLKSIRNLLGKMRGDAVFKPIGNYELSGTQGITASDLSSWLAAANIHVTNRAYLLSESKQKASRLSLGLAQPLLASEILVVGKKT